MLKLDFYVIKEKSPTGCSPNAGGDKSPNWTSSSYFWRAGKTTLEHEEQ